MILRFPLSPCAYQSESDIGGYYRSASIGQIAAVRHTQHGLLRYDITKIEGVNLARGRIYIAQAGAFYAKSGKNCFHPKGQTRLVVPTEAVLEWAATHPRGAIDYSVYPTTIDP